MKKGLALLIAFGLLTLGLALPVRAQSLILSPEGKSFIKDAASSAMMEVQLGQVAHERGGTQQVKDFGGRMMLDHGKAAEELAAIAAQTNLKLPVQVAKRHTLLIARLSKLSGKEFDKQYLQSMVKSHTRNVARFKKALIKVKDHELNAWTDSTLPLLQEHLQMAKDLARNL
jgi:putative membrane protein